MNELPLHPETFKDVFRRHPAGVAVVTLTSDGQPVGFTATSVISVSADPPLFAFAIDATSSAWTAVSREPSAVVNFLAEGSEGLAARFAERGIDRFAGVEWSALPSGEPVLDAAHTWVRGVITERIPAGRSVLVLLEAVGRGVPGVPGIPGVPGVPGRSIAGTNAPPPPAPPLVYHDREYRGLAERLAPRPTGAGA